MLRIHQKVVFRIRNISSQSKHTQHKLFNYISYCNTIFNGFLKIIAQNQLLISFCSDQVCDKTEIRPPHTNFTLNPNKK